MRKVKETYIEEQCQGIEENLQNKKKQKKKKKKKKTTKKQQQQ